MLVRYSKAGAQEPEELAKIYTLEEHGIKRERIEYDARRIIHRLKSHGFQAFIVGGAVRDLLNGRKPKDFDIVTDAHPSRIHKIFWDSRIIGRRFRLVHVYTGKKVMEVSTFRSSDLSKHNAFGTMKEDVMRRDFSFNALYYCPEKEYLYDYVGGYDDILDKKLRPILPLDRIFIDDPVRVIRAVRYSMITGFSITGKFKKSLRRDAQELQQIPSSRLTEEIIKILYSGKAEKTFRFLLRYEILSYLLPHMHELLTRSKRGAETRKLKRTFFERLRKLDKEYFQSNEQNKGKIFATFTGGFINLRKELSREEMETQYKEAFRTVKYLIKPITPPNKDIEQAVRIMFKDRGLSPPKRRRYGKARRKK